MFNKKLWIRGFLGYLIIYMTNMIHLIHLYQVDVKIELDDEGITLEAWVPRPDDKAHTPVVGAGPNKPLFERTVSGKLSNLSSHV